VSALSLARRGVAEAVATALLTAAVVGSGIMGERLAGGNLGLTLLANTLATGAALVALILTFGPLSGAHLNPAVTLAAAVERGLPWREVPTYLGAQCLGSVIGVTTANAMFALPPLSLSRHVRAGPAEIVSEIVATFGLLAVVRGCSRYNHSVIAPAVAAYITSAYWFTASTSFANPAVTVGRALTDTFAGIRPVDVPAFILAQLVGAAAATVLFRWFEAQPNVVAEEPEP